jgi:hypothetical protein
MIYEQVIVEGQSSGMAHISKQFTGSLRPFLGLVTQPWNPLQCSFSPILYNFNQEHSLSFTILILPIKKKSISDDFFKVYPVSSKSHWHKSHSLTLLVLP